MNKYLNKFINKKGAYVLVLYSSSNKSVQIGRLGKMKLKPGWYIYTGSAFGSGGLAARLKRHLSKQKKIYWHIDYLLQHIKLREIWFTDHFEKLELEWVKILSLLSGNNIPMKNFGSSDSKLDSHLFYFENRPSITKFRLLTGMRKKLMINIIKKIKI